MIFFPYRHTSTFTFVTDATHSHFRQNRVNFFSYFYFECFLWPNRWTNQNKNGTSVFVGLLAFILCQWHLMAETFSVLKIVQRKSHSFSDLGRFCDARFRALPEGYQCQQGPQRVKSTRIFGRCPIDCYLFTGWSIPSQVFSGKPCFFANPSNHCSQTSFPFNSQHQAIQAIQVLAAVWWGIHNKCGELHILRGVRSFGGGDQSGFTVRSREYINLESWGRHFLRGRLRFQDAGKVLTFLFKCRMLQAQKNSLKFQVKIFCPISDCSNWQR